MLVNNKIKFIIVCAGLILGINTIQAQEKSLDLVTYTIEFPKEVKVGAVIEVRVVFNIKPGYYVYAPLDFNINQGKIVTKAVFKLPEEVAFVDRMVLPESTGHFGTYSGEGVTMTQKFKISKAPINEQVTIQINVTYQTCNEQICYPPVKEKKNIIVKVIN